MTLDEAIAHAKEKAEEQEQFGNCKCADEHRQLAEWLEKLKLLKLPPQTNADLIRAMSDEELAAWIAERSPGTTAERWLGWLRQEATTC